ncbi:MAG TPA: sigma-70 family RNA polymerase sigma factor [Candidatus Cybelea sp.]|jgi:RNA polymerase sigma-70 factor (ECF subfamily)
MIAESAPWPGVKLRTDAHRLFREAADGEIDGFIRAIWPQAYRVAFSVLRDHGLAEDAAQEACARILDAMPKLRAPQAFNVWLYRIVVRAALSIGKKQRRAEEVALEVTAPSELAESLVKIDLMRALDRLTPCQRIVVALHYYADMSSRDIAKVLAIPDSTVRFHVMNARKILEPLLTVRDPQSWGEKE